MLYSSELSFLQKTLNKCHLQTLVLNPSTPIDKKLDLGLRVFLNLNEIYNKTIFDFINPFEKNAIYKLKDPFSCCYILMMLPDNEGQTLLSIGPYVSNEITREQVLELAEKFGLEPRQAKQLETYFTGVPVFPVDNSIFCLIDTFAETIYGGSDNFSVINLSHGLSEFSTETMLKKEQNDSEKAILSMQIMESRYSYENEMMQAVAKGQTHKAELMLSGFSHLSFESRLSDPLRNAKNYCVIMNTLLRKAAENGGVHPIYLDSTSSDFAKKIELLNSIYAVQGFMIEMFRAYCRLVNKHSMKNYSTPVQKAIVSIDSDLTADLSLSSLAKMQNISAGYLSALFKKETGQTLTDYVNSKRIKHAIMLLKTTNLQIQTIAQYCGILDIQYFSKMFKKHTGKSPKEYRETK